jgi:flavin reductase (DIM6/NTAB) family NADH-FMN oxidoreductase RutF
MSVDTRFESDRFRHVLGHFPTGVAAVTAIGTTGAPTGMAVGSFTSVSLTPPLVAFLPDKASTTFPHIRSAGRFCINVLSAGQEDVCRSFATKGGDKFGSIGWTPAASGAPILDGALAWIDCEIDVVHEAGDHYIVVGRVLGLDVGDVATHSPLLFFRGGYVRVGASSLVDLG